MRHAIFSASDAGCGDFLVEHWLRSLRANVQLDDVDVHILDYGLTAGQRAALERGGATCHACRKDGLVPNIRFRDLARVLEECRYDQVLSVDAGDIIFQADIRHLFDEHKSSFRAVCEEVHTSMFEVFMDRGDFSPEQFRTLIEALHGKPIINSGMLLAPAAGFDRLWAEYRRLARGQSQFGSEQMVVNYLLYREGFVCLDPLYNFVLMAARRRFHVRDGVFYDESGRVIHVVHNAGGKDWLRRIDHFGFGPRQNRPRRVMPALLKAMFSVVHCLHG